MTQRRTSLEAYNQIKEQGLLSRMRWIVYDKLYLHGPVTASELASKLPPSVGGRGQAGNVHARLKELVEQSVAYVVRERMCSVTKHTVMEYDVTDHLPSSLSKKTSNKISGKSLQTLRRLWRSHPDSKEAIEHVVELAGCEEEWRKLGNGTRKTKRTYRPMDEWSQQGLPIDG